MKETGRKFVVATPVRSVCDDNARALARVNALRFIALGTRRGTAEVPRELTRLNPAIGAAAEIARRLLSGAASESLRFRLHPWFDHWVKPQIPAGDHIVSSYGYANASFKHVRQNGGETFLDAGNSHPENFWAILVEEHRRWNWQGLPIPTHQQRRALEMMPWVSFVLSPSTFVTQSFLSRGFSERQIIRNVYPTDLSCFEPAARRPKDRPLTIISTGQLSLRKGTPYLLEAYRAVRKCHPTARLLLTRNVHSSAAAILAKHRDLPIDWAAGLPHPALARRLQEADVFVLPSLEDGFARTVTEAMACGLPVVVTPNTGASDLVTPGVNGEVVPVRDSSAIAEAIMKWGDRLLSGANPSQLPFDATQFTFENFESQFLTQLRSRGLLS